MSLMGEENLIKTHVRSLIIKCLCTWLINSICFNQKTEFMETFEKLQQKEQPNTQLTEKL